MYLPRAVCGCLFALLAACGDPAHEFASDPSDPIRIIGSLPADVTVVLSADWQATVIDDPCAPRKGWPVGVRFPRTFTIPIALQTRKGGEATWTTWWDAVKPGRCGWKLVGINSKADHAATFAEHLPSIAPNRIAFTCAVGCPGPFPHANDREAEPVVQNCLFSKLLRLNGMTFNPCIFRADGTMDVQEGDTSKWQHLLRPGQHLMRFILVDLEAGQSTRDPPRTP